MLNSIRLGYGKAAFFAEVIPLIEDILRYDCATISELNAFSIRKVCEFLDIKTEIVSDCSCYSYIEKGLRLVENCDYSAFPYMEKTNPIKKVARVIALCKFENADTFIHAIGGTELYSKKELAGYGIDVHFIKMNELSYSQNCSDGSFEPNLSIIDVLMHNGKEKTKLLLNEYTLV